MAGLGLIVAGLGIVVWWLIIPTEGGLVPTGLKKFGAIVGEYAEIGCNSVINPGSIIGRNTVVYPGTVWRGVAPSDSIVKTTQTHSVIARRD